ncbi:hypothetical protein E1091_05610 [Micromonospora fluostatini]|uniref:Methylamine utilisation protein MauE domain-containing protein n=1 Tax=Micromonospora fluostatini TaxID=1629071 RepID=A0ABY2DJ98_9ACTN|nr:hypothetical protein E1091_05610 [Micromonospora fluostatini]
MDILLAAFRVVAVVVFAISALGKLRAPEVFQGVLADLGLARVRLWWLLIVGAELLTAALMVSPAPSWLSAAAVLTLAAVFAAAGVRAMRLPRPVVCACFGDIGRRPLGRPQLLALPLWTGLAAGVLSWQPASVDERTAVLGTAILIALAVQATPLVLSLRRARADRLATTGGATSGMLENGDQALTFVNLRSS